MKGLRAGILVVAALVGWTGAAGAATLYVANNGKDSAICGPSRVGPCRSISRAISHATAGDTIEVGPGLYGDVDHDYAFTTTGDEAAEIGFGCHCVVKVNKAVTIVSRAGATATVITAGEMVPEPSLVRITASNVTFGKKHQGFTLTNSVDDAGLRYFTALSTNAATQHVSIGGNTAQMVATGFRIRGTSHTLTANRATDTDVGFEIFGNNVALFENIGLLNEAGVTTVGNDTAVSGNVMVGNVQSGVAVYDGTGHIVAGNSVLGNNDNGVQVDYVCPGVFCTGAQADVFGNNLFGNGNAQNCGLANGSSIVVDATSNFWGAAAGPGADPADYSCNFGAAAHATVNPISTTELAVVTEIPR